MTARVESLPVLRSAAITEPRSEARQIRELPPASSEQPDPEVMGSEPSPDQRESTRSSFVA